MIDDMLQQAAEKWQVDGWWMKMFCLLKNLTAGH